MESSSPPGCPTSKPGSRHSSAISASHIFSEGIPPTIMCFKASAVRGGGGGERGRRGGETMHLKLAVAAATMQVETQTQRGGAFPFVIPISVIDLLPHLLFRLHFYHIPWELISSAPLTPLTTTLHPTNQNSPAEHINTKPHESISHVLHTKIPAWQRGLVVLGGGVRCLMR